MAISRNCTVFTDLPRRKRISVSLNLLPLFLSISSSKRRKKKTKQTSVDIFSQPVISCWTSCIHFNSIAFSIFAAGANVVALPVTRQSVTTKRRGRRRRAECASVTTKRIAITDTDIRATIEGNGHRIIGQRVNRCCVAAV